MRHLRIEEQEMREVQLILWRERALVAERAVRELEVARGELLELVNQPGWLVLRPVNTGRTYEFEVRPGERPVVCIDKRGMLLPSEALEAVRP